MWDHSYSRLPFKQTEPDSRLGVKKQFRLLEINAGSQVISANLRDRSTCFQTISSD